VEIVEGAYGLLDGVRTSKAWTK
jgi:hypothetical protein